MEFALAALLLIVLGVFAGFSAGLLGIGGGAILVPGLYYILTHFGYEDTAMHVAVGTSLLTIILTGISSAFAHHKRGAVDIPLLKGFLPGVLIGVLLGTWLAHVFKTQDLKIVFAASQICFALYMLLRSKKTHIFEHMPRQPWFSGIAALNAGLATLMGVGGGVQNVIFMTVCNVPIHRAIATAAAIGPFIALIGAAGFVFIGWDAPGLPPYSIGYINLPAFACIVGTSMALAPLGAKTAHALPVPTLKKCFAVFMLVISLKMLSEIIADFM